jgi:hypothetical protein
MEWLQRRIGQLLSTHKFPKHALPRDGRAFRRLVLLLHSLKSHTPPQHAERWCDVEFNDFDDARAAVKLLASVATKVRVSLVQANGLAA